MVVACNFKYHVDFPSPLICQSNLMSGKYRLLIRYTTFSTSRLNSFLSNGSLTGIPQSFYFDFSQLLCFFSSKHCKVKISKASLYLVLLVCLIYPVIFVRQYFFFLQPNGCETQF